MPNHNAVPEPEQIDRELKVLELRRAGLTWQRIAQETGYKDHSGAYAAYKRALKRTLQQPADELRQQELDRLDRLQLALWQKALQGDIKAILAIVRIMERRSKLLGLDAPVRIEQEITTWDGNESIDKAVRDLAALLARNNEIGFSEGTVAGDSSETLAITTGNSVEELGDSVGAWMGQDPYRGGMDSLESPDTPQDETGGSSTN